MRTRSVLAALVVLLCGALGASAQGIVGLNPTPLGVYQWNQTTNQAVPMPNSYGSFALASPPQPILLYGWNASLGQWTPCTIAQCFSGSLSAVSVNGVFMPTPNFNGSSPAPDAGYTAATWKVSGNNVIAEVPLGAGSPLTTNGDIYGFSTTNARIPVGADATVLTADSTQALGVKWAPPSGVQYNPASTTYIFTGTSVNGDDTHVIGTSITVSTWSISGGVCTVTNTGTNGLAAGDWVDVAGLTSWPAAPAPIGAGTGYTLFQAISTGLSSTQFEFNCPLLTNASGSGGTAYTANYYLPFRVMHQPFFNGHGSPVVTIENPTPTIARLDTDFATLFGSYTGTPTNPVYLIITNANNDQVGCATAATTEGHYQSIWAKAHAQGMTVVAVTDTPAFIAQGIGTGLCPAGYQQWTYLQNWLYSQGKSPAALASGQYWDILQEAGNVINDGGDTTMIATNGGYTAEGTDRLAKQLNSELSAQGSLPLHRPIFYYGSPVGLGGSGIGYHGQMFTPLVDNTNSFCFTPTDQSTCTFQIGTVAGGGSGAGGNIYTNANMQIVWNQNSGGYLPVLDLEQSGTSMAGNPSFYLMSPNLSTSNDIYERIGVNTTTGNAIHFGFSYQGSGLSTNFGFANVVGDTVDAFHFLKGGLLCAGVTTATIGCPTSAQFSVGTTGQFNVAPSGTVNASYGTNVTGDLTVSQLATPSGTPTGAGSTTGGTVAANTYYARIALQGQAGTTTLAGTESAGVTTTGSTSSITWSFTAVPNQTYQIWVGTSPGGENSYFTYTPTTTAGSYVQTTSAGTAGTLPATNTTGNLQLAKLPNAAILSTDSGGNVTATSTLPIANGGTGATTAASALTNLGTGFVSVVDYGAVGDDSTDNSTALNACVTASEASNGTLTCFVPNGIYRARAINITSSARVVCQSANAILKNTGGANGDPNAFYISSQFASTYNLSGAFTLAQTQFTLTSTAGLSVGQDVFLTLGESTATPGAPQVNMFNTIMAINGLVVTLSTPLPEAVAAPTTLTSTLKTFATNGEAQNIEISGCGFDYLTGVTTANDVQINWARNVHVHDIFAYRNQGSVVLVANSENVVIENAYINWATMTYAEAGLAISGWGSRNVTLRNIYCSHCENEFMTWEQETRDVHAEDIYWGNPSTGQAVSAISVAGHSIGITIERGTFNSAEATLPIFIVQADTSYVTSRDINLLFNPSSGADLSRMEGSFTYLGKLYPATRTVSFSVPILPNQSNTSFPIPQGLYKSMKIYSSGHTGITQLFLLSNGGGMQVAPALVANTTVDLASTPSGNQIPQLGSDYYFANMNYPKVAEYYTDSTTLPGSYLFVTVEYYPDGVNEFNTSGLIATGQIPTLGFGALVGSKGTFTCTAGGTVTISNANESSTSDVVISLNTASGTVSTVPAINAVTPGTGFTVLCSATDTSTYNYDILN